MNTDISKFWKELDAFADSLIGQCEKSVDYSAESKIPLLYFLKERGTICSIMILLERHFVQDARILLRSQAENMIYLAASTKDKEGFRETFAAEFTKQQMKSSRDAAKSRELLGQETEQHHLDREKELEESYKEIKDNTLSLKKMAEDSGLQLQHHHYYTSNYHEVHSLPFAVVKYFNMKEKSFIHLPDVEDIPLIACTAFKCYIRSMWFLIDFFKLESFREDLAQLDEGKCKALTQKLLRAT